MIAAFWWLAILVGFISLLAIPALLWELWLRSDYRAYVRHQRALEAQRDDYVAPMREAPVHRRTIVRAGIVR